MNNNKQPSPTKIKFMHDPMTKNNLLQRILEETGANNVRSIYYDDFDSNKSCWVIEFKSDLKDMHFESFSDVFSFITTESSQ